MPDKHSQPESPDRAVSTYTPEMAFSDVYAEALELTTDQLVQYWNTFMPSVEIPYPAVVTGRSVDDVAAVIAGSKPATILGPQGLEDPLVETLITFEEVRFSKLSTAQAIDYYGGPKYFLGKDENVRILAGLYQGRGHEDSPRPADESFHRAVGNALGYPKEAIDSFIERISPSVDRSVQKGRVGRILSRIAFKR